MWKFNRELIQDSIQKISLYTGDRQVTYSEVIELWQKDDSFREVFISTLANTPMSAYFWETPPVTKSTIKRTFEFVLVNASQLDSIKPDPDDFSEYFNSASEVATFSNLGNDALLIAPCPITELSAYPHLASFVRQAPKPQQHLLWQTVGQSLQHNLNEQPVWVNTSGLGVHWLHVRLDSQPKYYTYEPYKSFQGKQSRKLSNG